jgi:hypothetical protein
MPGKTTWRPPQQRLVLGQRETHFGEPRSRTAHGDSQHRGTPTFEPVRLFRLMCPLRRGAHPMHEIGKNQDFHNIELPKLLVVGYKRIGALADDGSKQNGAGGPKVGFRTNLRSFLCNRVIDGKHDKVSQPCQIMPLA